MLPEYRDFRLHQLFGWTHAELRATPARHCDWMLAIDEAIHKAEVNAAKKRTREMRRGHV